MCWHIYHFLYFYVLTYISFLYFYMLTYISFLIFLCVDICIISYIFMCWHIYHFLYDMLTYISFPHGRRLQKTSGIPSQVRHTHWCAKTESYGGKKAYRGQNLNRAPACYVNSLFYCCQRLLGKNNTGTISASHLGCQHLLRDALPLTTAYRLATFTQHLAPRYTLIFVWRHYLL